MARAVCARFENVLPIEHIYALVRSQRQLDRALGDIEEAPGVVLAHHRRRQAARGAGRRAAGGWTCPASPALDPLVSALQRYLGAATTAGVGAHRALDNDYFNRMDALNYAIGHDDGQGGQDLDQADVVLVGVSRTSQDADLHLPGAPGRAGGQCPAGARPAAAGEAVRSCRTP